MCDPNGKTGPSAIEVCSGQAARLIVASVCCMLGLEQKAMSDEEMSDSDRRNAVAVRTLQEKNRDAIRWDASGHNIDAVALHHDYGKALSKLLEDLGDFPELDVTSKALPREEDLDAICRLTFLKSLTITSRLRCLSRLS